MTAEHTPFAPSDTAIARSMVLGDSVEILPQLSPNQFGLVVTSFPYGVGKWYEAKDGKREPLHHTIWLIKRCFEQFARVVKPGGYVVTVFGDNVYGREICGSETLSTYPMSLVYWAAARKYGFDLFATRIWRKRFASMGVPFALNTNARPVLDYEYVWTWRKPTGDKKQALFVGSHKISRRGVWATTEEDEPDFPPENRVLKSHKAAFPVAIPLSAILVYTKPNEMVLDPFMGTGSTAIAAMRSGRMFFGIEKSQEWFDYSIERIKQERNEILRETDNDNSR